jgi:hypothetical protein
MDALVESCRSLHFSFGDHWDLYSWADLLYRDLLRRGLEEGVRLGSQSEIAEVARRLGAPAAKESLRDFLTYYPEAEIPFIEGIRSTQDLLDHLECVWRHPFLYAQQRLALVMRGQLTVRKPADQPEEDLW